MKIKIMKIRNRVVIIMICSIARVGNKLSANNPKDSLNKTPKHLIEIINFLSSFPFFIFVKLINIMLNFKIHIKHTLGFYLLLISSIMAQQVVEAGENMNPRRHQISLTYGLPFLGGALNGFVGARPNILNTSNHIGLRYAYLFNKATCFEMEYTRASAFVNTKVFFTKHRVLARASIQTYFSEVFNFFGALGWGIKYVTFSPESGFTKNFRDNQNRIPFSIRAAGGIKVWLFKCIGLHTEVGLGGPLLQFGLHYRFQMKQSDKYLD
jgi:hypothetical protein